jgi:hypothetical protein
MANVKDDVIYFCVGEVNGMKLVPIVQGSFFDANGFMDDQIDEELYEFLGEFGFYSLDEATFEYKEDLPVEEIEQILLDCDEYTFERNQKFDDFIDGLGE